MRTLVPKSSRSHKAIPTNQTRSNMARLGQEQATQQRLRTNPEEREAEWMATSFPRMGHDFSQIPVHLPLVAAIQMKLAISQPGDEYEQQADRLAEQVMRNPEPRLQRACSCAGSCCDEKKKLQMKPAGANGLSHDAVPSIVHEVLRTPGQPLDADTRTLMELRFGHDFSRIRVHADSQAERSAQAVHARAYTVGPHIVFGAGEYATHSRAGRTLLAHELTHTIQQGAAASQILQRAPQPGTDDLPTSPTTETDAIPTDTVKQPKTPCTYKVTYANPKEVDCDTVWRAEKGTAPRGPLCGKRVIYEIVSVTPSDKSCPLKGLEVSEKVKTMRDGHSCTPPGFKWPAPTPCKIGDGGKLTGCTDTLTICGLTSDLKFGGCEENVKQEVLVGGKTAENHTIKFELDVSGNTCTATITRK